MAREDLPNDKPALDDTDRKILQELQNDPRQSMSQLAKQVGISAPTAAQRTSRLERRGVIRGYRVDVDPAALGRPVAAYVRIRPGPGQLPRIAELVQRTEEVVECHRITGEDCFLVKVHVPTVTALEEVLDKFLLHGQTTTSIVQSSPVPWRQVPID